VNTETLTSNQQAKLRSLIAKRTIQVEALTLNYKQHATILSEIKEQLDLLEAQLSDEHLAREINTIPSNVRKYRT